MRFNPRARLDRSRVRDTGRGGGRGGGSGGGGFGGAGSRLPIPGGAIGGGGIGGLILLVLVLVLTQCTGVGLPSLDSGSTGGYDSGRMADSGRYDSCSTGQDANGSSDCARVAVENSLYDYWSGELGQRFRPESAVVTFTGSVDTGCGPATSDVGPFYCPTDESIYLDTGFFDAVLERELGGPDGGFVEAYVLAHEYGHHVQNLLGTMGRVRTQQGPTSDAVRLELQADCYAGMWAKAATTVSDAQGEVLVSELTQEDIQLALQAAAAVGDDRIQQKAQGQVTPETFTHGTALQRDAWFTTGLQQGSLQACDTFSASRL